MVSVAPCRAQPMPARASEISPEPSVALARSSLFRRFTKAQRGHCVLSHETLRKQDGATLVKEALSMGKFGRIDSEAAIVGPGRRKPRSPVSGVAELSGAVASCPVGCS